MNDELVDVILNAKCAHVCGCETDGMCCASSYPNWLPTRSECIAFAVQANPEVVLRAMGAHQPDAVQLPDIWCLTKEGE